MEETFEKFAMFWDGPFSQWQPARFTVCDVRFNCAEQFMMVCKASLFKDIKSVMKILQSMDPREQKKLGRNVRGFDVEVWAPVAKDLVYAGNLAKFTQNADLLRHLGNTSGCTLVEASPYDKIWGIGLAEEDPLAWNRATWQGTNWLGEVLTNLRTDLENNTVKDYSSLLDKIF